MVKIIISIKFLNIEDNFLILMLIRFIYFRLISNFVAIINFNIKLLILITTIHSFKHYNLFQDDYILDDFNNYHMISYLSKTILLLLKI